MSDNEVGGPATEALSPRRRLRELLSREGTWTVPGVQDAFGARAAQEIGFEAVYLAGGLTVAISRHAMPDMTMVSPADVVNAARPIVEAIDIPLIVDFDDGGGNALQVRRNVRLAEGAGISGVQIEDTDFTYPKHLPPAVLGNVMDFSGNHLLSREAAVQRVRSAVEARQDPDLVIIARTDGALISHEEAMVRMRLLADAGADAVFPSHFPFADTREAVEAIGVPLMNIPIRVGSTTDLEREQAREGGMRIILEVAPVAYANYQATLAALNEIYQTGGMEADFSSTLKTVQEIIRYPEWGELAKRYAT